MLVLHDATTFSFAGESERENLGWTSSQTQGFNGHFALALSLALRHQSRVKPGAPATTVISACQLRALRTLARTPLPVAPTVKDVLYAIAAIGEHIARNGPPGWITLRSGFDDLLLAERVIAAVVSTQRCD